MKRIWMCDQLTAKDRLEDLLPRYHRYQQLAHCLISCFSLSLQCTTTYPSKKQHTHCQGSRGDQQSDNKSLLTSDQSTGQECIDNRQLHCCCHWRLLPKPTKQRPIVNLQTTGKLVLTCRSGEAFRIDYAEDDLVTIMMLDEKPPLKVAIHGLQQLTILKRE